MSYKLKQQVYDVSGIFTASRFTFFYLKHNYFYLDIII